MPSSTTASVAKISLTIRALETAVIFCQDILRYTQAVGYSDTTSTTLILFLRTYLYRGVLRL